jgi:hypothetical protein
MSWWNGLDRDLYVALDSIERHPPPVPLARPLRERAGQGGACAPVAVLARQVATPNYEAFWFVRLARRHGFRPVVIEHASDRFTVHNPTKRALATLPVVVGRSRDGRAILRRQRVVKTDAAEGRPLDAIRLPSGERLIDYHHRKLRAVMGDQAPEVIDMRDILPDAAAGPARYYPEFFKLLSGGAVLLEDFVACAQTAAFFRSTVLPAWQEAVAALGQRPQIARLIPGHRTGSPRWIAYPPAMADDPAWLRPARRPAETARIAA